jgi:UDP-xylose/UDP-N-acetylglucosamine transporter B4
MSILVNYAYAFDVSVPIHTLFRSCNIISSVLLGYCFFGMRYSMRELTCVVAVTGGLMLATVGEWEQTKADSLFAIGVTVLTAVLFLQAWLGHMQHRFYERFGKEGISRAALADEYLFYSHAASLIPMIFLRGHIAEHLSNLLHTAPLTVLPGIPAGIVWLILNLLTQAVCIKGVFYLSASYSPLTVNLTLSVRKFCSVLISVILFNNPWGWKHVFASMLIFGGVFVYFNGPKPGAPAAEKKKTAGSSRTTSPTPRSTVATTPSTRSRKKA